MSMKDFYNQETAREALDVAVATKKEFIKEIETIDKMIFILEYYLSTGEILDPSAFNIENPNEEINDE